MRRILSDFSASSSITIFFDKFLLGLIKFDHFLSSIILSNWIGEGSGFRHSTSQLNLVFKHCNRLKGVGEYFNIVAMNDPRTWIGRDVKS